MTNELPTQDDFDPWHGSPDAIWAHGLFGGLSIDEAIQKFNERPDVYQEAFMGMGGKAFAYYFPVIEHFVYSLPNIPPDVYEYECAYPHGWILAKDIDAQLDAKDSHDIDHLSDRIIKLAQFVLSNTQLFEADLYRNESVADAWRLLLQKARNRANRLPR